MRLLAIALGLVLAPAPPADEPFAELTFREAAARASREGRLLLLDFTAAWCPPCRRMEAQTWPDAELRAWLAEHALAIQVDLDAEPELARRFDVQAIPTVLFLRGEAVLDRHTGFLDAPELRAWGAGLLEGRTMADAREAELVRMARSRDASTLHDYAEELAHLGRLDEAAAAFVRAWDASRSEPSMVGVRHSFLLSDMLDLAERHPPARPAFERLRRESALRAFASDPPDVDDLQDWFSLSKALGHEADIVAWFEQEVDEQGRLYGSRFAVPQDPRLVPLRMRTEQVLVELGRYDEVMRLYEDPVRLARNSQLMLRVTLVAASAGASLALDLGEESPDVKAEMQAHLARLPYLVPATIHAVAHAAGRPDVAADVAQVALEADKDGWGRLALVEGYVELLPDRPDFLARWLDEAFELGAPTHHLSPLVRRRLGLDDPATDLSEFLPPPPAAAPPIPR